MIITPGALLIKSKLPDSVKPHFDMTRQLDKSGVTELINKLVEHGGNNSGEVVNDLAKLFFLHATEQGYSTPLSDYDNDSSEKKATIDEFEKKVSDIVSSKRSDSDKSKALSELSYKTSQVLNRDNLKYMVSRGSIAGKMALTGARGNPSQFGMATASPLMAQDVKGNPIPVAIKNSFSSGLTSAEHLAMSYGGRASTVLSQLSTSLPGALFKQLTPNLMHEVITIEDCHTTNGGMVNVNDKKSCIGRVLAGTSRVIDERYYKELAMSKKPQVRVRTPLTCEAHEGLCAKCYGVSANGQFPKIGFNAGIVASQSASEVLTQAMLSTKHQGGVAGAKKNAYEEASNLLNNRRENFYDEAGMATRNGFVTNITKTALGDHQVSIDGTPHFVSKAQTLLVRQGDKVRQGEPLSSGTLNPRKLVEYAGIGKGREYLATALRGVYSKTLDPRHFEIISKNMIKYVTVDHPGQTDFFHGQTVNINDVQNVVRDNTIKKPIYNALGDTLARSVLDVVAGTVLTQNLIDDLAKHGIKEVYTSPLGLKITPIVPGLQTIKLLDKNWVSKLSFNRLQDTLKEAASEGASTSIHSTDPVASYVMGNNFGRGPNGKY